jgi:hypothetical protein
MATLVHDSHQQPLQHHEDNDGDSEFISSSNDIYYSNNDNRIIRDGADDDCVVASVITPHDDEDPPKPRLLQLFCERDHHDGVSYLVGAGHTCPCYRSRSTETQPRDRGSTRSLHLLPPPDLCLPSSPLSSDSPPPSSW